MPYRGESGAPPGPSVARVDARTLPAETLERLARRLAETPIHVESAGPIWAVAGWGTLGVFGLGLAIVVWANGIGIVHGHAEAHPFLAALLLGAAVTAVVRNAIGLAHELPGSGGPLPRAKVLTTAGLIEARGRRLRIAPADRIARIDVRADAPDASGLGLVRIVLEFDDGTADELALFGTRANVPEDRLAELREAGEAIRRARLAGDLDALARLELLGREHLEPPSTRPAARRAPPGRRAWIVSGALGLAAAALAWLVVFPLVSLAAARTAGDALHWNAVARTHPLPWIAPAARAAIAERRVTARETLLARLAPPAHAPFGRLLDTLATNDAHTLHALVEEPPRAEIDAATAWLKAHAPADKTITFVLLQRASTLPTFEPTGSAALCRALETELGPAAIADVLDVAPARWTLGEKLSGPFIVLIAKTTATNVLAGDGARVYAALDFSFRAVLRLPGEPDFPLGGPFSVPAPTSLEVLRFGAADRAAPLDSSGIGPLDLMEDSQVYADQLERAAATAAEALVAALTRRP